MEATPPSILGEAISVVSAKLAKQILRGSVLTWQNSLKKLWRHREKRLASTEVSGGSSMSTHRAIPDLLSWFHCYSLFAVIICSKYSENFREIWAYDRNHDKWRGKVMWGQQVLWYVIGTGLCPLVECYSYVHDRSKRVRMERYILGMGY